jgi:hypothetical protein
MTRENVSRNASSREIGRVRASRGRAPGLRRGFRGVVRARHLAQIDGSDGATMMGYSLDFARGIERVPTVSTTRKPDGTATRVRSRVSHARACVTRSMRGARAGSNARSGARAISRGFVSPMSRIRARSTPADARAASARGLCESLRVFSRVNRRVVARYEVVRRAIECVNGRQLDATSNCSQKRARGFSGPVASLGFQILAGLR